LIDACLGWRGEAISAPRMDIPLKEIDIRRNIFGLQGKNGGAVGGI
jgi:hypothetical protein